MTQIPELVQTKIDYYRWKEGYQKVMEEYVKRVTTLTLNKGYMRVEYDSILVCYATAPMSYIRCTAIISFTKSYWRNNNYYPVIQQYRTTFDNIPYMVKNGIITKKYQDYIREIS